MKKVMYVLLLVQSTFLMAQKTVVTTYGEKITVNTGANNGVSANGGNVQLGGALIKPTTITTDVTNTLEINSGGQQATPISAIKLVDGNQAKGKVLTSDANGVATWQPTKLTIIKGVVPDDPYVATPILHAYNQLTAYTGCYITLAPGKWRLEFGSWIQIGTPNPEVAFSSIFFSTSTTDPQKPLVLVNNIKLNSIIIPDLYTNSSKDKYGTGTVFIDLTAKTGDTEVYLWSYSSLGAGVAATPSNTTISSMNGMPGAYGPYTYLTATNVD